MGIKVVFVDQNAICNFFISEIYASFFLFRFSKARKRS